MKPPDDMNDLGDTNDLYDPSETDEALFMRWRQNRDDAAYYALDARYRQRLLALVGRTLKRNQASAAALACDVDDIVQDVFTALNNCPDPVGSVRAVLYQAVQSHLLDMIRASKAGKRDYRKTVHSDEMSHYVADPHAEPAIRDTEIDVKEAVARLSPSEQQAVRLELDGHSHASGAEAANVPETTYWSRVRSARKHLKGFLAPPIILLAIVGSTADGCNLDVYENLCTSENDEDEVSREDGGHHDSNKQRRKSLMRLPIWPVAAEEVNYGFAIRERPGLTWRPTHEASEGTVNIAGVNGNKMGGGQIQGRFAMVRSERFVATRSASPPPPEADPSQGHTNAPSKSTARCLRNGAVFVSDAVRGSSAGANLMSRSIARR